MKKILTILAASALGLTAYSQSAIRQLENMTGTSINRGYSSGSYEADREASGYGFDYGYDYSSERESAWEARKAAKEARKAAKKATKYTRTSKHKLKDYKPLPEGKGNVDKAVPTELGETGDLAVYAKYDKKGDPTYGIWNKEKSKWHYKPKFQSIQIVGPHAAPAMLEGKVGIIDPTTKEVTMDFTFDNYKAFHYPENELNTIIALGKKSPEGKDVWYLMEAGADGHFTQTGPELSDVSFYRDATGEKIAYRIAESKKMGLLNGKGESVLPPVYDGLEYLSFAADDASCYQSRMIDETGRNRYGIVDDTGRSIVPCSYDKIQAYHNGKYGVEVSLNGKKGWYGTDGVEIFPAGYDTLDLMHFWDGNKHRAYFSGSFTADDGTTYHVLYDTQGRQLTEPSTSYQYESDIKHLANELEEFRL